MQIKTFVLSDFAVNSYLVIQNNDAILIDVGFDPQPIEEYIIANILNLKAIFLTHAHLDHIGGVDYLREKFNVPLYIHENEKDWLKDPKLNGSFDYPFFGEVKAKPAEVLLREEKEIQLGNFNIGIIFTPGHTPGGISYYINGSLFTGDTLFYNSIGRTDLYGGNHKQLIGMITNKLLILPDNTKVYPGHGERTTIKEEKKNNPFL